MDGAGFGPVIVAGIHEASCTVAGAFKHVEFFHLGMPMGTVHRAWLHAAEYRRSRIDDIVVQHFDEGTKTDFLPLDLGCSEKGERGFRLALRHYLLGDLRQDPFPQ